MRTVVLLAAVLLLAVEASATTIGGWTGFRCPQTHNLVSLGDTMYEVRAECRPPDDEIVSSETRVVRRNVRRVDDEGNTRTVTVEDTISVQVNLWTFDFGRNQFIRLLRFENGVLISIADGNKGAVEPQ